MASFWAPSRSTNCCHVGNLTKTSPRPTLGYDLDRQKMLVYYVKNENAPRVLEGGFETVLRPVFVPRAGCLIVAVVEEAEPQL